MGKRIRVNGGQSIPKNLDTPNNGESSFSGTLFVILAILGAGYLFLKLKKSRDTQKSVTVQEVNKNDNPATTKPESVRRVPTGAAEYFRR